MYQERTCNPDYIVAQNPTDTVSSLLYSPAQEVLAAGSWDGSTYLYTPTSPTSSGTAVLKASIPNANDSPVLSMTYTSDGTYLATGCADGVIRLIDMNMGTSRDLPAHNSPVSALTVMPNKQGAPGLLVSGGWDKTLRFWDLKGGGMVHELNLGERVYDLDCKAGLLGVLQAENKVLAFDAHTLSPLPPMSSPYSSRTSTRFSRPTPYTETGHSESPDLLPVRLMWQARALACFPDGSGLALGGIEGRVDLIQLRPTAHKDWFIFKCHRNGTTKEIYPVNKVVPHPLYTTIATCSSDGTYCIWDRVSRTRCKTGGPGRKQAISAGCFDPTGKFFAYATGYDWSRGYLPSVDVPVEIRISPLTEKEARGGSPQQQPPMRR
jgi:mRNA export factor